MISDAVREEVLSQKNRNSTPLISSTAHSARRYEHSNAQQTQRPRTFDNRLRPSTSNSQQVSTTQPTCTHCGSFRHRAETCLLQKLSYQNERIDALVKQSAKPGNAKKATDEGNHVEEESDLSDFSEAQACRATALRAESHPISRFNFDSGSSNTLVPTTWPTRNSRPSTLVLRTADDGRMKAKSKGLIALPQLGIDKIEVHTVPDLAEPLLSVADVTDKDKRVLFLKSSVLVIDHPQKLETYVRDSNMAIHEGKRDLRSYYVDAHRGACFRTTPSPAASMLTWHRRLSHLILRSLQDLQHRG